MKMLPWQQGNFTTTQLNESILSSYLAQMFSENTYHYSTLCVMETLLLETRESLSYMISFVLGKQELNLLGHDIFVAISVELVEFYMPEFRGLKICQQYFTKSSAPLGSILNDRSLMVA